MNKNSVIKLRLTEQERELLLKDQVEHNFSNLSMYLRSLILSESTSDRVGSVDLPFNDIGFKSHNLKIRLSDEDYCKIKGGYDKLKFSSLSAYIRFLIFSKSVNIAYSSSDEELTRSTLEKNRSLKNLNFNIAKIGVNINQVVKSINSSNNITNENVIFLANKLDEINILMKEIQNE